ncbi:MAG: carbohydrate kinase [Eubacteriales bacterium]
MLDAIAIGELLIDFTVDRLQDDGYPVMAAHPGGSVANFLAPLAKFGKKTALVSKVGNDALGRQLVETIKAGNIDATNVNVTDDAFTTLAFVTRDANGEREFSFARKPGADTLLSLEDINMDLLSQTKVLHFGTVCMTQEPARSTHYKVVETAKAAGAMITFDPNLREPLWADLEDCKAQMEWGFRRADVVKISDNEVEFLFDTTPEEGAKILREKFGVKLVFVTLGRDGCHFANQHATGTVPGHTDITPVDTTGAGDIFGGTATWGILETGKKPEDLTFDQLKAIADRACVTASLSTENLGGISGVPEMDAIEAVLKTR